MGSLAGGRWAPPQSYEVLYTSRSADCAIVEVLFHLERQPIFPSRKVDLHTLAVHTERTVDISDSATCRLLGLDESILTSMNYQPCQDIGHAAEFLGFDSMIVKSARHNVENVVILLGHLTNPIEQKTKREIDWSKYRK